MNGLDISDSITARVRATCGLAHPHADPDPTVIAFGLMFGDVMDTDFVIQRLTRNTRG